MSDRLDVSGREPVDDDERAIRHALKCLGLHGGKAFEIAGDAWKALDRITATPRGAVSALEFYADPATWDAISEHGTVTTATRAKRDGGQRARDALADRPLGGP